jgi:Flp pilus assembly pilin Flp
MERCPGDNASPPVPLSTVRNALAPFVDMVVYDATRRRTGERRTHGRKTNRLPTVHESRRIHMSKAQTLLTKTRGATIVEYAMLIIAVMFIAAATFRILGNKVKENAQKSTDEIGKT